MTGYSNTDIDYDIEEADQENEQDTVVDMAADEATGSRQPQTKSEGAYVYEYGLLPPIDEYFDAALVPLLANNKNTIVIDGKRVISIHAILEEQIWLGRAYRNELAVIEKVRRNETEAVLRKYSPELCVALDEVAEISSRLSAMFAERKAINGENRRLMKDLENDEQIKAVKRSRQRAWAKIQEIKKPLYGKYRTELKPIDARAKAKIRYWRNQMNRSAGLASGSYLIIENDMKRAGSGRPPVIRDYKYDGKVGGQLTGSSHKVDTPEGVALLNKKVLKEGQKIPKKLVAPYPASRLFRPRTRQKISIDPVDPAAWCYDKTSRMSRADRRRAMRTTLRVVVAYGVGQRPIVAHFPMIMHRPLPEGAAGKWFKVFRRKEAGKFRWKLQLTIDGDRSYHDLAQEGMWAVDINYRQMNGTLRVATAYNGSEFRHLFLPQRFMGGMNRADGIKSNRDTNFDRIVEVLHKVKEKLEPLVAANPRHPGAWWFNEHAFGAHNIITWGSQRRLQRTLAYWANHRWPGDSAAYNQTVAWAKRDIHLYTYEMNIRCHMVNYRKDIYRRWAANLRQTGCKVAVEDINWAELARKQDMTEEGMPDQVKRNRHMAAPGNLKQILLDAGMKGTKVNPKVTTMACDVCGFIQDFDRKILTRTCNSCGTKKDQDEVAAINIYRKAQEHMQQAAKVGEPDGVDVV
jgi:regulator of replication initiation timing